MQICSLLLLLLLITVGGGGQETAQLLQTYEGYNPPPCLIDSRLSLLYPMIQTTSEAIPASKGLLRVGRRRLRRRRRWPAQVVVWSSDANVAQAAHDLMRSQEG